jgi:hypothetical protein
MGYSPLVQWGSHPPAVFRSGAGIGNLGRILLARLCGRFLLQGRTPALGAGYGLIAALIVVVCFEALTTVGTKLTATVISIAGSL